MADFFSNLKEKLSEKAEVIVKKTEEVADVVAKKTEQTIDVQKIKNQIRTMERNNERDLLDIGKMIYDEFLKCDSVDDKYRDLCEAIKEREESIEKMQEDIANLKGLDVCPSCKAHVDPEAAFCPKCGVKIEKEEEDVVDVEAVEVENVVEEAEFEDEE